MSVFQLNMNGKTKLENTIDRIKYFEPPEGYYLAFSGGKDSVTIKALADMANVKYDANYNITGIDPPELVYFIREKYPDVIRHQHEKSIYKLIEEKLMPPTRLVRYCCSVLKENGGIGRFVITGVRWQESARRKNTRNMIELDSYGGNDKVSIENRKIFLNSDNDEKRKMIETCSIKGKHVLNPIIDWTEAEVWEFIKEFNIPYCELYNEGFTRLGCIGCPMVTTKKRIMEFARWIKYKENYIRSFKHMLEHRNDLGLKTQWKDPEEVFNWWLN